LKIGQYLPKLWAIKQGVIFYETRCIITVDLTVIKQKLTYFYLPSLERVSGSFWLISVWKRYKLVTRLRTHY